jgi:hypothetical protein
MRNLSSQEGLSVIAWNSHLGGHRHIELGYVVGADRATTTG